jgi:hypothetical protein
MFTVANFGGASLPWLVGFFSAVGGGLRLGLFVPLAGGLAMLALFPKNPEFEK